MTTPTEPLRWGILSTGRIAATFTTGIAGSKLGRVVAVGSRTPAAATTFAATHGIPTAHGSYAALLADPAVEAVYIATPHPQHTEWTVKAAAAGKHILCEKPLGLNHAEAMVMAEAARAADVTLMEAYMYRCHPQTARVADLVRSGAIGPVRLIRATFSFKSAFNPASRLWANAAAGGGILDVGGYATSYARLIAGAATGRPFADPIKVTGAGHLHPETGVDVYAAATLEFPEGLIAQVAAGVGLNQENGVWIHGDHGTIYVPSPFLFATEPALVSFHLRRAGAEPELITVESDRGLYAYEADAFATAVRAGERDVPACPVADTLGNLATLDQWRTAIGLTYAAELPENFTHPHARRPLARAAGTTMPYAHVPGVAKPIARLVMGCDNQRTMPHAAAMWDDYFERGGNAFDTAFGYGGGLQEKLLGWWMKHRGVRDDVVVIGKGAHTPLCTPEWLSTQLLQSLERLQTDHVDLYFMHRDNLAVPVGEFVDVLHEHVEAGRIKVFGGSNWSLERFAAANRYAKRKGRHRFTALSNNLSLAVMQHPVWAGAISAGDQASRRWLKRTQVPVFSWSSQARGYFLGGQISPGGPDAEEIARCWDNPDNRERRTRAEQLATEKGVRAINIAAAYVLAQPFPTFALIGPRTISETISSLASLAVTLTPREVAWLALDCAKR